MAVGLMKPYKSFRRDLYRAARVMGNVQPWLELSPRKIIRRELHKFIGKGFSKFCFGGGMLASVIRAVLGLR